MPEMNNNGNLSLQTKERHLLKKIALIVAIVVIAIVVLYAALYVYNSFRPQPPIIYYDDYSYGVQSFSANSAGQTKMGLAESASDLISSPRAPQIAQEINQNPINQPAEQKIIKTGNLNIQANEVEQTVIDITRETNSLKGFVQNSSINESPSGQKSANLTLRVPAKDFETMIEKIKSLAKLVVREDINGREVTAEYVDIQADLSHSLAVEAQYLELLQKTQTVEEIIAVRNKLDQVQGEIERLKGRIRYLDNQTEMSTISVYISSEVKVTLPIDKWQPWEVFKESTKGFISNLQNFVNFVIMLLFFLLSLIPYLILIAIVVLIIRVGYKRRKKK